MLGCGHEIAEPAQYEEISTKPGSNQSQDSQHTDDDQILPQYALRFGKRRPGRNLNPGVHNVTGYPVVQLSIRNQTGDSVDADRFDISLDATKELGTTGNSSMNLAAD